MTSENFSKISKLKLISDSIYIIWSIIFELMYYMEEVCRQNKIKLKLKEYIILKRKYPSDEISSKRELIWFSALCF